jgi:hypothetical protein
MGKLDKAVGYLSGAMEFVQDNGIIWRREFITSARLAGLKIDFIDPTNKPGGEELHVGEQRDYQIQLQKSGNFEKLKNYVHQYRRIDLRFVDLSDFLISVVDPKIPQWGTSNEIYVAEKQHKPIFVICEGGLYNLPRWLFDVVDLNCVFKTANEVIEKLVLLDSGKIELDNEWVLIRKFIEENRLIRKQIEGQITTF